MFWRLVWKETLAATPPTLLAFLLQSWLAVSLAVDFESPLLRDLDLVRTWGWHGGPPLQHWDLLVGGGFYAIGFGLLLGLWQTVPESVFGTSAFFAHAVRRREWIVSSKMLAALALFAAAIVAPMLAAVASVTTPRPQRLPVEWADSLFLWVIIASGLVGYLGALAAGLRGGVLPWRRLAQQITGLATVAGGLTLALAVPWFGVAVAALVLTAGFAVLWAFAGFQAREF